MSPTSAVPPGRFGTENPRLTETILADIGEERERQDEKFPDQRNPAGTGWTIQRAIAMSAARIQNDDGARTWESVLREEFFEATTESDPALLRKELVQLAAVAVRIIENIDAGVLGVEDQPGAELETVPDDLFEDVHDLGVEG